MSHKQGRIVKDSLLPPETRTASLKGAFLFRWSRFGYSEIPHLSRIFMRSATISWPPRRFHA